MKSLSVLFCPTLGDILLLFREYFVPVSVKFCVRFLYPVSELFCPCSERFCLRDILSLFRGYFVHISRLFCPWFRNILFRGCLVIVSVLFCPCVGDILSLYQWYFVSGLLYSCLGEILSQLRGYFAISRCHFFSVLVFSCSCLCFILLRLGDFSPSFWHNFVTISVIFCLGTK